MKAPNVAVIILPMLTPVAWPKPINLPTKPPTKAPPIPSAIVTIQPPPSLPGISHFANAPAIKPKIIQDKMPILFPQLADFSLSIEIM